MAKRDRLGRGLGALLGEYLPEEKAGTEVVTRTIPVGAIAPNPFQPRREFSEQDLADLVASIKENGLLQPIVVRPSRTGRTEYELVAGERRWRAVTRLGWREVPATVRDIDDRTLLVLALVENLQRAGLSAFEEAEGYRRLGEEFGLSQQAIAEMVGKDRSTVANTMRLLALPASIRQLVNEGKLSPGHARALLAVSNDHRMRELAMRAVEEGWTVREIEEHVQKGKPREKAPRSTARDPLERQLEEELQRVLGTAARIRRGRGQKGRIEIPFFTSEDFERIFQLLAGTSATDVVS